MKEIALYTLDIAQNSITARARHLDIALEEGPEAITLTIADDGTGMSPELLARVSDPFTTTRTTRKMGLGIPLLRLAAEQTGGRVSIESTLGVGTTVTAVFCPGHIDCPPVGDIAGTGADLHTPAGGQALPPGYRRAAGRAGPGGLPGRAGGRPLAAGLLTGTGSAVRRIRG